ncbi:hypothetical protein [Leptospira levettii]|uniref:hypothetical protein n=1 Tax=Leptospira levettii TaxID=2023178 RepID=UPI00108490F3|nr:hypothetical protein [Leptospira levettii]TGK97248.1 hypothetical protein EHQ34_02610 [Leptospira levettii]
MIKALNNRLSDPFLSIFSITLILWNWRILLILFFDSQSMIGRIAYIDEHYIQKPWSFFEILILPFIISLFWFLLFPKIKAKIVDYDEKQKIIQSKLITDLNDAFINKPESIQNAEQSLQFHAILPHFYHSIHNFEDNSNDEYRILRHPGIELGQWLYIENNRVYLAISRKENSVYANSICVKKINEEYIVAQFKGNIPLSFFNGLDNFNPQDSQNLFLGPHNGKSSKIIPKNLKNQKLGEWKKLKDNYYLNLTFSKF